MSLKVVLVRMVNGLARTLFKIGLGLFMKRTDKHGQIILCLRNLVSVR